jgi:hypothetical protein
MALLDMGHRVFGGNLDVWKNGGLKLKASPTEERCGQTNEE